MPINVNPMSTQYEMKDSSLLHTDKDISSINIVRSGSNNINEIESHDQSQSENIETKDDQPLIQKTKKVKIV